VRQSGTRAARHGRISKRGSSAARHVLVEAAWAAIKTPGPLHAFYERVRSRRGSQIAVVAVARKLCALCWQLLTKQEDYAFKRATLVERKLRTLELRAELLLDAATPRPPRPPGVPTTSANSPSPARPSSPTNDRSPTGNSHRQPKQVRPPHCGAHLQVSRNDKQRGRRQPHLLRSSSRSTAPPQLSHDITHPSSPLTFMRRSNSM